MDAVRSAFNRLLTKTGIKGSFKLCGRPRPRCWRTHNGPMYATCFWVAAGNIADIHYAKAAQGRLAKALAWLAKQYGL